MSASWAACAQSQAIGLDTSSVYGHTLKFHHCHPLPFFLNSRLHRYERSPEGNKMAGARVTQRHVASQDDIAYHEGQGLLVPLSEVDNPTVGGWGRCD